MNIPGLKFAGSEGLCSTFRAKDNSFFGLQADVGLKNKRIEMTFDVNR